MKATYFRFKPDDGMPVWYGIAIYENRTDLFEIIDQHGDPYGCQLKPVGRLDSICFRVDWHEDGELDGCFEYSDDDIEFGDGVFDAVAEPDGWVDANFTRREGGV